MRIRGLYTFLQGCLKSLSDHRFRIQQYYEQRCAVARPGERGALAVEYAFCMILAAFMTAGVLELFSDMSVDILEQFMTWISKPYP